MLTLGVLRRTNNLEKYWLCGKGSFSQGGDFVAISSLSFLAQIGTTSNRYVCIVHPTVLAFKYTRFSVSFLKRRLCKQICPSTANCCFHNKDRGIHFCSLLWTDEEPHELRSKLSNKDWFSKCRKCSIYPRTVLNSSRDWMEKMEYVAAGEDDEKKDEEALLASAGNGSVRYIEI